MKSKIRPFILILVMLSVACNHQNQKTDNSHTDNKSIIKALQMDSTSLNNFILNYSINEEYSKNLNAFYKKRKQSYAWLNPTGLNQYGKNFINLLNKEESNPIVTRHPETNSQLITTKLRQLLKTTTNNSLKPHTKYYNELELLLSVSFFDYARRNWKGGNADNLEHFGWFITQKKCDYENLLDSVLTMSANRFDTFEPVYRQYALIKDYLIKYETIQKTEKNLMITPLTLSLKTGSRSSFIPSIKRRLHLFGDLQHNNNSDLFDSALEESIKIFQGRLGLETNGVIEGKTILALNVSFTDVNELLLLNMERYKWIPVSQAGYYIVVNIPAFKLYLYHNDSLKWTSNVIVGESQLKKNTTIFSDSLELIVFNPYWTIPQSIVISETLPHVKKNHHYLLNHNMEVVGSNGKTIEPSSINWNKYTTSFPYTIRQKPGENNALGLVKFIFPNIYDIYIHDTPAKSLFNETSRMFSHGCIRLEEPFILSDYLLCNDKIRTKAQTTQIMKQGKEVTVKLNNKVPVFITYFTAWVDREGKLNLREDIYNRDQATKELLFHN